MIHPSTMAGPNWFTGSFGTTNPFQQTSSTFFRNTPFQGPQGGFGPGNTPFQNQPFGFGGTTPFQSQPFGFGGTTPFQNTINEIVRQTVPTTLASYGIPISGFQGPFGSPGPFGFQTPWSFQTPTGPTPYGPPFPTSGWLNPGFFSEIIRQATNQAFQNTWQSNPAGFTTFSSAPTTPFFGSGPIGQTQDLTNFIGQICQQACQQVSTTLCQAVATCVNECINSQNISQNTPFGTPTTIGINPQQQNLWNVIGQICQQACQSTCQTICQAAITCANESINTQNRSQNIPFGTPTGFGINPQQQNLWNLVGQICQQACQQACTTLCQAVITCVNESINTQNRSTSPAFFNTPSSAFRTPGTPFNFSTPTPQYGFTPGIPTGAGAF